MAKATNVDRERHWREVIERQQASGQSIVGFCAKERLSPGAFHAWKRRLGQAGRKTGWKATGQALVPVQVVSDPVGNAGHVEVQWPSGVMLRVQGCDAPTIGAVVTAISAQPAQRARRC
jgi:hypothetical protein